MSKNTSSSAFRKIDVDQYNEDNYKEDECGESQSPPVGPDEKEIINFLNQYPFIKNVLKDIIIFKAKVSFVIFLNLIFFHGEEYWSPEDSPKECSYFFTQSDGQSKPG